LANGVGAETDSSLEGAARRALEKLNGAGGAQRYVIELLKGAKGEERAAKLADEVVKDLLTNAGRKFDYKFFRGPYVVHVEVKPSTSNWHHAVKEMLQDIALAGSVQRLRTKPGESPLIVWFIDPSIAGKPEVKPLIAELKKNGIVVITDSESLRALETLDSEFKRRYGMDLIGSVADWYGIKDPEAGAAFKQAVESSDVYGELAPLPDRIVTIRSGWY